MSCSKCGLDGGWPVQVCATACEVFDIVSDPSFLANVNARGERLRAGGLPGQAAAVRLG
jgi:hypothetical protein